MAAVTVTGSSIGAKAPWALAIGEIAPKQNAARMQLKIKLRLMLEVVNNQALNRECGQPVTEVWKASRDLQL
mgnify:CR=1 FL=1